MGFKKILIIAFNNIKSDGRILRQIHFLKDKYNCHVICYDSYPIEGVSIEKIQQNNLTLHKKIFISFLLKISLFEKAYWKLYNYEHLLKKYKNHDFDLILANDIETLPLAIKLSKNAKTIFDAHEYYPRHFEDKPMWRFFFMPFNKYLCKKYIPCVDAMTTVANGLAEEYKKEYQVSPDIITNAPYKHDLQPQKVDPNHIRIIHHGIANFSRKIENMIHMMDYLDDRYTLDLILVTPTSASSKTKKYIESLRGYIKNSKKVNIIDPVASDKIVSHIKKYDIGLFILEPINFNYANALPNKFFEFIQARLAVAIGPTPEMAFYTKKYNCGVVADDFSPKNLANKIAKLTPEDIYNLKINSNNAAKELTAEKNMKKLRDIVDRLVN